MQRGFYYGGQGKHILRARLYSRFAARCGQVKRSGFQAVGQKDHVEGQISQNLRRVRRQNRRAKGYCQSIRIRKGKIRRFSDEDFEKLKTPKDKTITIEKFVGLEEIDPIYFDKPYYVAPEGADKAYAVLVAAMERRKSGNSALRAREQGDACGAQDKGRDVVAQHDVF